MWLLNVTDLKLEEFYADIPPYAILSHVWDKEEISFQDIHRPLKQIQSLKGFQKIRFCTKQAKDDGLSYCWIDTCCIDKSSSAQLTESINSMFQWYRLAEVCYAYLSDVIGTSLMMLDNENAFHCSKWFTRGWTLQELIAPKDVVFRNSSWDYIGRKSIDLASILSTVTGVPLSILNGADLSTASIAQRFSWAAKRETTRVEDLAYCLMGLFNVHMPMLYGEGMNAFRRLQEEIIKSSDDESIFAWTDNAAIFSTFQGLFATTPAHFEGCGNIISLSERVHSSNEFVMTNKGLRIRFTTISSIPGSSHDVFANLNCNRNTERVRILIRRLTTEQYVRVQSNLSFTQPSSPGNDSFLNKLLFQRLRESQYMYFREKPILPDLIPVDRVRGIILHLTYGESDQGVNDFTVSIRDAKYWGVTWDKDSKSILFHGFPQDIISSQSLIVELMGTETKSFSAEVEIVPEELCSIYNEKIFHSFGACKIRGAVRASHRRNKPGHFAQLKFQLIMVDSNMMLATSIRVYNDMIKDRNSSM
jgi:hypothetical protein